jgi:hypothetical protein
MHITSANKNAGIVKTFGWSRENRILDNICDAIRPYFGKRYYQIKSGVSGNRHIEGTYVGSGRKKIQNSFGHEGSFG